MHAFFRRAAKDGLKRASLTFRGRRYAYESSLPKSAFFSRSRVRSAGFGLALVALAALAAWQSGLVARLRPKPVMVDARRILQLVVEKRSPGDLRDYLQRVRYRDIADDYGWTPLHWAAFLANREMMELLESHGADAAKRSSRSWFVFPAGSTPADILRLLPAD